MRDITILDMDGVFVHSEWAKHIAEMRVFKAFGSEMTDEDILYFRGRTNTAQFSYAIQKYGWRNPDGNQPTPEDCAQLKLKFYKDYMRKGKVHLFHGFWDFYNAKNGLVAVTTSSSRGEYDALSELFGFEDKFPLVITANDVEERGLKGKPEPDPYVLTADILKHKGYETTPSTEAVEDSTTGVYSAYDAGFRVLGVTHLLALSRRYAAGDVTKEVDTEFAGNTNFFDVGHSVQTKRGKEIIGLGNTSLSWALENKPNNNRQSEILNSKRFKLAHHFHDLL